MSGYPPGYKKSKKSFLLIQGIKQCLGKFRAILFALQNTAFDIGRIAEFDMQRILEDPNDQIERSGRTVGQQQRLRGHPIESAKDFRNADRRIVFGPMER